MLPSMRRTRNRVVLSFICPHSPSRSTDVKRTNGQLRALCLSQHWLNDMREGGRKDREDGWTVYSLKGPLTSLGALNQETLWQRREILIVMEHPSRSSGSQDSRRETSQSEESASRIRGTGLPPTPGVGGFGACCRRNHI
jgi:hypothetical protein